MSIIPALTPKDVIKVLERAGFVLFRIRGSHQLFIKSSQLVIVAMHNRDLKKGTLHAIIKSSGMTVEEFLKLL